LKVIRRFIVCRMSIPLIFFHQEDRVTTIVRKRVSPINQATSLVILATVTPHCVFVKVFALLFRVDYFYFAALVS